ncbi:MAG: hypothetical protein O3C43_07700 [Verrucomicrobia bacterium]|nr:hypothetical protein [Verrucomicrobiota bacterium]MDA1066371.1 hypothetical protein [Verrucomicrobiota bacterium]
MTFDLKTLSFKEKVLWVNLIITVALFGYYFIKVMTDDMDGQQATWLYMKVVFWAIVIEIVLISVLSGFAKKQEGDERDKLYETRGYRYGYFVLFTGLIAALWQVVISSLGKTIFEHPEIGEKGAELVIKFSEYASPFLIIHIMLFTLVLAEITKSAVQLFYYRRGF